MDQKERMNAGHTKYGMTNEERRNAENMVANPAKDECQWCAHSKHDHLGGSCKDCNCKARFNKAEEEP